ncbi:hypothetical protein [Gloeothece verrucosa]|uniref:Uncharacterized protein n=1 Tax=Gloeothece verrucosa (strain PCC 7822) TaxID=497965 RepID=E0ULT3_GLOV7|nr:hypothetical protein [Gloeothece verrucosa]ADN17913.1 hypothetical protein Cyan7822_6070 [Gloeothece verrucosa PCC 7822]
MVLQTAVKENLDTQAANTANVANVDWKTGQTCLHNGVKVVINWFVNKLVAKVTEYESNKRYEVAIVHLKPLITDGNNAAVANRVPSNRLSMRSQEIPEIVQTEQLDIFSPRQQPG